MVLFLVISAVLSATNMLQNSLIENEEKNCSEPVLKRNKRFLVFTNGGTIKFGLLLLPILLGSLSFLFLFEYLQLVATLDQSTPHLISMPMLFEIIRYNTYSTIRSLRNLLTFQKEKGFLKDVISKQISKEIQVEKLRISCWKQ